MIAYKGFDAGLICRGHQFDREGWNETKQANCRRNGFHAATNPLDVLCHYPDTARSVYCMVECSGDLDEDDIDEKVSCTRIKITRILSVRQLIVQGLLYIANHPKRKFSTIVKNDSATAFRGYAVVKGSNPKAKGEGFGDILGFVKTDESGQATDVVWLIVDNLRILPGKWYTYNSAIRMRKAEEREAERSAE